MLLGGGGSFSAGGPGKGMYSRFYENVLNRHYWMESATAMNLSYGDNGLFYIEASCPPELVGRLCAVLLNELLAVTSSIGTVEFTRSKNQVSGLHCLKV